MVVLIGRLRGLAGICLTRLLLRMMVIILGSGLVVVRKWLQNLFFRLRWTFR